MTEDQSQEAGKAVYRGMDRETLDAAYNNTDAVADSAKHLADWIEKSAFLRGASKGEFDIEYGPGDRNRIDFFFAEETGAPLFCFIHGGYWQRNSKEMFNFLAKGPCKAGFNFANIGYTLAPTAPLSTMVSEVNAAIDHLAGMAGELGFDPQNIIVGGWSAGAHLAVAASDNANVKTVLAISGIYDLEPISLSYINDKLLLSEKEIDTLSPLRNLPATGARISLFYGEQELPELKRQSEDFAEIGKNGGLEISAEGLKGHNHYTILDELAAPDGRLTKALGQLAG